MKKKEPEFDKDMVRDLSVAVYKMRLGDEAVARMMEKDADDGSKFRDRASSYDVLTRCYLRLLPHRETS